MDYKLLAVQVFALAVVGLMANLPIVQATTVRIYDSSGSLEESVDYDVGNAIAFSAVFIPVIDPDVSEDSVWVRVSPASTNFEIIQTFLFKCKDANPEECSNMVPQVYEGKVNTYLAWKDVSRSSGVGFYPQVANIMVIVQLSDLDGNTRFMPYWYTFTRNNYNEIIEYPTPMDALSSVNVYAESDQMVKAIGTFIETSVMLPINWLSKITFSGANEYYGIGGNEEDLDSSEPELNAVVSPDNDLENINREFYFIFPETSTGITVPFTVNLNPSFSCGDNRCDESLGETWETCCLDCPCSDVGGKDYYCDYSGGSSDYGECRDPDLITAKAVISPVPQITDCSQDVDVDIRFDIQAQSPSGLAETADGYIKLGSNPTRPVTCEREGTGYDCTTTVTMPHECGSNNAYSIGPNDFNITITFNNGLATTEKKFTFESFANINLRYECGCEEDEYCDSADFICKTDSMFLTATPEIQPIRDYSPSNPNLEIKLTLENSISDEVQLSNNRQAEMFMGSGDSRVLVGSVIQNCNRISSNPDNPDYYSWDCEIPITIPGYVDSNEYRIDDNTVFATFTYVDGLGINRRFDLEAEFGMVTIKGRECGNGYCDIDEDSTTCCDDCGCSSGEYCDSRYGCTDYGDFTVRKTQPSVISLQDCEAGHEVNLVIEIDNDGVKPSDMELQSCIYRVDGSQVDEAYIDDCNQKTIGGDPVQGTFVCNLIIPPVEDCEDIPGYTTGSGEDTYYVIGGASASDSELECSIIIMDAYKNNPSPSIPLTVSGTFDPVKIKAKSNCGDGDCESNIGESSSNCCIDCPCSEGYFCNWGPDIDPPYNCRPDTDIYMTVEAQFPPCTSGAHFHNCEITNELPMRISFSAPDGMPEGFNAVYYGAKINNNHAQFFGCEKTQESETVWEYDCILKIPSRDDCTRFNTNREHCLEWNHPGCRDGDEDLETPENSRCVVYSDLERTEENCQIRCQCIGGYVSEIESQATCEETDSGEPYFEQPAAGLFTYSRNSVEFVVNYYQGTKIKSELFSADFGNITIKQTSNTVEDILEQGMQDYWTQYEKLMDISNEMFEELTKCYERLMGLMKLYIISVITIPLLGGFFGIKGDGYWNSYKNTLEGTTLIGEAILKTVSDICELKQLQYQLKMEEVNMRMELIEMNMCMLTYQRLIDNGQCMETSCFTNLIECINFDAIDSSMNALDGILDDAQDTIEDISDVWIDVADFFDELSEEKEKEYSLEVKCNNKNTEKCCSSTGKIIDGNCQESYLHAKVWNLDEDCTNPRIYVEETTANFAANENVRITQAFGTPPSGDEGVERTLLLYCDKNGNNQKEDDELVQNRFAKKTYYGARLPDDEYYKCNCYYVEEAEVVFQQETQGYEYNLCAELLESGEIKYTCRTTYCGSREDYIKSFETQEECLNDIHTREAESSEPESTPTESLEITFSSSEDVEFVEGSTTDSLNIDFTTNKDASGWVFTDTVPESAMIDIVKTKTQKKDHNDLVGALGEKAQPSKSYGFVLAAYTEEDGLVTEDYTYTHPEEETEPEPETTPIVKKTTTGLNLRSSANSKVSDNIICVLAQNDEITLDSSEDPVPGSSSIGCDGNHWVYGQITKTEQANCEDKSGWLCDAYLTNA